MKELRLRGISTQEVANAYVPEFMADYNERFAKDPLSTHDAHRPVRDDENLALIFLPGRKIARSRRISPFVIDQGSTSSSPAPRHQGFGGSDAACTSTPMASSSFAMAGRAFPSEPLRSSGVLLRAISFPTNV